MGSIEQVCVGSHELTIYNTIYIYKYIIIYIFMYIKLFVDLKCNIVLLLYFV